MMTSAFINKRNYLKSFSSLLRKSHNSLLRKSQELSHFMTCLNLNELKTMIFSNKAITNHLTNLNVTLSRNYFTSLQTYLFTSVSPRKQFLSITSVALLQQVAAMAQQGYSIGQMHAAGLSYEVIYEGLDYALQNEFISDIMYATIIDKFNNTVIVYTVLIVGAVSAVGVGIYYLIKYLRSRPPSGLSSSEISVHNAPKDSSSTSEPSKYVSQLIAAFRFKKQLLLVGSSILIIALFTLVVEITLLS